MSARDNCARVVDELASTASKRKPAAPRNTKKGARTWLVLCPLCVRQGAEQTVHAMKSPRALGCKKHHRSLRSIKVMAKNPERTLKIQRETYQRHRPERLKQKRDYYHANHQLLLDRAATWRADHRERLAREARERRARQKREAEEHRPFDPHYTKLALI